MIVYLNGHFMPADDATVSIFDRSFLYGDGLFETIRAYQGKVFALEAHLKRLYKGAKIAEFTSLPDKVELEKAIQEVVERNKLKDAYVRLTLTRGAGGRGLVVSEGMSPTVLITASSLQPYGKKFYQEGMKITFLSQRRGGSSVFFQLKTTSYLCSVLGKIEAEQRGADEGVFLNDQGEVTEGTVSNVFIVSNNMVATPPGSSGILPGITRQIVFSLAKELSLELREESLWPEDIIGADEVFLTNSLMEVMPVATVDEKIVGSGKPGPLTLKLYQAYRSHVVSELDLSSSP